MNEVVDGEYQTYEGPGRSLCAGRQFFGAYPELVELVKDLSDRR